MSERGGGPPEIQCCGTWVSHITPQCRLRVVDAIYYLCAHPGVPMLERSPSNLYNRHFDKTHVAHDPAALQVRV